MIDPGAHAMGLQFPGTTGRERVFVCSRNVHAGRATRTEQLLPKTVGAL
jgi:hypothetical protein